MYRVLVMWLGISPIPAAFAQAPSSTETSVHEAYAELPGARIFYRDSGGSGVPVVFLHAASGSSRVWGYQIPVFQMAGYRLIAFDRRGWGRTVTNAAEPRLSTAADDLLGLLDRLGIERIHLVGTAAGGSVAFDFALSFPERLRSLVVANAIGGVQDQDALDLGRRLRPPQFDALPPEFRELGPAYRAAQPDGVKRWMDLEKLSRPAGPPAAAQPLRNRLTFSALETIKAPTLLITGGADLYAPPPLLRLYSTRIRGAESFIIPEAGHSPYWEKPEVFNRAVLDFIGKH